MRRTYSRNIVIIIIVGSVLVLAILLIQRWRWSTTLDCGDGVRRTIDMRDFVTSYSGYSLEFQAEVEQRGKFEGKLSPVRLQQMSDSLQSANEFRKMLVAGYNSCAVTKADFNRHATQFQLLDVISRQIDATVSQGDISGAERKQLESLVTRYLETAKTITEP